MSDAPPFCVVLLCVIVFRCHRLSCRLQMSPSSDVMCSCAVQHRSVAICNWLRSVVVAVQQTGWRLKVKVDWRWNESEILRKISKSETATYLHHCTITNPKSARFLHTFTVSSNSKNHADITNFTTSKKCVIYPKWFKWFLVLYEHGTIIIYNKQAILLVCNSERSIQHA